MKGWAEMVFNTPHSQEIYEALAPELNDEIHRSNIELVEGPGFVRLKILGEDVVSLRAALNTWIRLVKIAIEMVSL